MKFAGTRAGAVACGKLPWELQSPTVVRAGRVLQARGLPDVLVLYYSRAGNCPSDEHADSIFRERCMTRQHRVIVGLEDIVAVTFECTSCRSRISFPASSIPREPPRICPTCNRSWWSSTELSTNVSTSAPALVSLMQAIVTLRVLLRENQESVKVLLEFDSEEIGESG